MTAAAPAPPPTITAPAPSAPTVSPYEYDARERAAVDASARGPVLFFFGNAILWLMLASVLGFISSIQLHSPGFLADIPFLTYGRVWPAYMNTLIYGWASLSGMGVTIWLLARLCRVRIKLPGVLVAGAIFWQIGLTVGIIGILAGKTTGLEGLEIPRGSAALMLFGYFFFGLWGALVFGFRKQTMTYVSVWYLMAAIFWFPWTFTTAHFGVALPNVTGVMQSLVASWSTQNVLSLWLTSIGLAAAYYLIPKVINRPIYSYNLAAIGFWTFLLVSGLTGALRLSGGPIPAWLVSLSISATILLLVQIATVSANLVITMRGSMHMVQHSPTIRFTFFGVIAFMISGLVAVLASLRSVDAVLHFTLFQSAQVHLVIYAFFSMVMFGAMYYILPRLVGCEWLSSSMISFHFLGAAYGGGLLIITTALAGLAAGSALADPAVIFTQIYDVGSFYYIGRSIAWVLILISHAIFGLHFLLMLLRIGQPGGEPTLFPAHEEGSH
jgi:cytochrome c oxidase cbb3-type subunit 1